MEAAAAAGFSRRATSSAFFPPLRNPFLAQCSLSSLTVSFAQAVAGFFWITPDEAESSAGRFLLLLELTERSLGFTSASKGMVLREVFE
jgi:hypothetical protein